MLEKKKVQKLVLDYLVVTLASFIFAMAWECFMIPNGMSAGGMMGICTIVQYATVGLIPAQYSYLVINALLIVTAVLVMGIGFGFKTIYCILMSSLAMHLLSSLPIIHCIPDSFFFMEEKVLIPVVAGCLEAIGIGLVIRYGGSTGGTDIIALMINKFWPISLSAAFLVLDLVVCSLLLFLPEKNFSDMCYGLVELVTFSLIIDFVVAGRRGSYKLLVFSEKYKEIADYIINVMDRGVTVLNAQGWYTKKSKEVLLILISQKELPSLTKVIKDIDARAFMSISPTHNVYGEGFEEIKAGVSIRKNKQKDNEQV